jgi:hypothetical protein
LRLQARRKTRLQTELSTPGGNEPELLTRKTPCGVSCRFVTLRGVRYTVAVRFYQK